METGRIVGDTEQVGCRARRGLSRRMAWAFALLVWASCGRSSDTVALVYCGMEHWIGNDQNPQLAPGDPSRMAGALPALTAALEQADLAHTAPPGMQGILVSFGDHVKVRVPRGPIATLNAGTLGKQADYMDEQSANLIRGISVAVDELEKAPPGTKVLIIVSDGTDENMAQAAKQIPALKQRLSTLGIKASSLVYKGRLSESGDLLVDLTDDHSLESTLEALTYDLAARLRRLPAQ